MYLSQTTAFKKLRAETGLSIATCKAEVKRMPKKADGAREKVAAESVRAAVERLKEVKPVQPGTIRPLSARTRARIQQLRT